MRRRTIQIVTNKNIDTYKDDFFKGLSLSQTVTSVAVILSAGGSFAFFYIFLHFPMTICIYLALPFALPFAVAGFMRIHGMSPFDYMRKKRKVTQTAILSRRPSYVVDAWQIQQELKREKDRKKQERKVNRKKVCLQTEDEIFLRIRQLERRDAY